MRAAVEKEPWTLEKVTVDSMLSQLPKSFFLNMKWEIRDIKVEEGGTHSKV